MHQHTTEKQVDGETVFTLSTPCDCELDQNHTDITQETTDDE